MEIIKLQKEKAEEIANLYNPNKKVVCEFKAPTGSGKTLIASYLISLFILNNENEDLLFIIATPSSSALPAAFKKKIDKYKTDFPFSKFETEHIESPSSSKQNKQESNKKIIPEKNKVYIFGKSSFGKGRIYSELGIIEDFIKEASDRKFKIIYIRDEAHIGEGSKRDNSTEAKNFEKLMEENAAFILKMTATPDFKANTKKVILSEKDLTDPDKNEGKILLKNCPEILLNKDIDNSEALEHAIKKFKEVRKEYKDLNINIRPAMLIQVKNEPTDEKEKRDFLQEIEKIKKTLEKHNLSWAKYFGNNDKESDRVIKSAFELDNLTDNDSNIDAIIFKIGPATGWDIPRACMLLQLRNVASENLNIQTIGRIRRNPYPNLEYNEVTDKYYLYSNDDKKSENLKTFIHKVQPKFSDETFISISVKNYNMINNSRTDPRFNKLFEKFLNDNKKDIKQLVDQIFCIDKKTGQRIYRRVISEYKGNERTANVSNPFEFLRIYSRLINNNKNIYNLIYYTIQQLSNDWEIQKEFLITILLERYKKDIIDCIKKANEFSPEYIMEENIYKPLMHSAIAENSSKEPVEISEENYLFEILRDNISIKEEILDSKAEIKAFRKIKNYFQENNKNILVWGKNLTVSNIFGEYIDDENNLRHSYFDFIVKFKNGIYLYIEVKNIKDIDEDKTKKLKKSYEEYFKKPFFDIEDKKLVISLWEVDIDNNDIFIYSYYDKNLIKENLEGQSAEGLLNTLSQLDS